MAVVFLEGFDKYGSLTQNIALTTNLSARLLAGEWTNVNATGNIHTPLSQTGYALRGGSNLNKQFYTNYPRLIGGIRFNVESFITTTYSLAHFLDQLTHQCCITLTFGAVSGVLEFRNGDINGTILASYGPVIAHATRYLEWDISFGNSAAYSIWLDGVLVISGTGDTTTTANNYASAFGLYYDGGVSSIILDDLYLFDTTGTTNNTVLLTNPRIETTFPTADNTTQFTYGAATLGEVDSRVPGDFILSKDRLFLRPLTVQVNCVLNSVSFYGGNGSPAASVKPAIYANGPLLGTVGALLSAGPAVLGIADDAPVTMPLTTPQSLTAGTVVWLGFIASDDRDVEGNVITLYQVDGVISTYYGVAPFVSGPPSTAPAMTPQGSLIIYGNLTSVAARWPVVSSNPTKDDLSYLIDLTPGHEDLYQFGPLSLMADVVHSVVLKGYFIKTDVGVRTVSLRTKSGAVDSPGTLPGQAPHVEKYTWLTSNFATDPNTSAQWVKANLNAALSGFKIDS